MKLWFISFLLLLNSSIARAQALSHLYAPRPPAGSAYVRVVSAGTASINVRIGLNAPQQKISGGEQPATTYRIVPGGIPLTIEIDGRAVKQTVAPVPDRFMTIVAKLEKDQFNLKTILEDAPPIDGLRAEVEFYNLIESCDGGLSVVDGPRIFEPIPFATSRRRSINPVEALLFGECGASRSTLWTLSQLKPGDHFSLFLVGTSEHPKLVGQLDLTEPYRESTQ
jgi:hypothetical protein